MAGLCRSSNAAQVWWCCRCNRDTTHHAVNTGTRKFHLHDEVRRTRKCGDCGLHLETVEVRLDGYQRNNINRDTDRVQQL